MMLLRVWCGPMCAAKTTGALHVARRYSRHGQKVVLLRPATSRRDHEPNGVTLATKNGEEFPCFDIASVEDITHYAGKSEVIWIDEPNHFKHEERLIQIVPELRKTSIILVSGLGATSELEPFGRAMGFLLSTADHVEWSTADCDACKTLGTATRSLYIGEAPKDGQLQVGGAESYRPVCPACWNLLSLWAPAKRRNSFKEMKPV
jgi:thymidine kinase